MTRFSQVAACPSKGLHVFVCIASSATSPSEPHLPLEVPSLVVHKKIIRKEIHKEITIGLTSEIKAALSDVPPALTSKILA